jgi:L-ascorbate metabolism protein UlaG (beta-lactamase superfamily)
VKLRLIRNATLRLEYARRQLMIDPYLAPRHSRPSFAGRSPNPLVELPCPPEEVVAGVELALVSHLHSDHFDPLAQALLAKDAPILCQPSDAGQISEMGFGDIRPVEAQVEWGSIRITRTAAQHGSGEVLSQMGQASGFVLQSEAEPTVYWAGDTIWNEPVAGMIRRFRPSVIVTHSSGAVWGEGVLIVMDAAQTVAVCRTAPHSVVVATHMEALDHGTVSRADLRSYALAHGITPESLRIPADGETLTFEDVR